MKFDIMVNGRKMGSAEISVTISPDMKRNHCVGEYEILKALKTGEPNKYYCMGDVEIRASEKQ